MSITVMKQAIAVLEDCWYYADECSHMATPEDCDEIKKVAESLRQAIAEAEKQEPVATVTSETGADITMSWWHEPALPVGTPLYTSPPQRKPLPYEKVVDLWLARFDTNEYDEVFMNFARAIEAAHGIKENT